MTRAQTTSCEGALSVADAGSTIGVDGALSAVGLGCVAALGEPHARVKAAAVTSVAARAERARST